MDDKLFRGFTRNSQQKANVKIFSSFQAPTESSDYGVVSIEVEASGRYCMEGLDEFDVGFRPTDVDIH